MRVALGEAAIKLKSGIEKYRPETREQKIIGATCSFLRT